MYKSRYGLTKSERKNEGAICKDDDKEIGEEFYPKDDSEGIREVG